MLCKCWYIYSCGSNLFSLCKSYWYQGATKVLMTIILCSASKRFVKPYLHVHDLLIKMPTILFKTLIRLNHKNFGLVLWKMISKLNVLRKWISDGKKGEMRWCSSSYNFNFNRKVIHNKKQRRFWKGVPQLKGHNFKFYFVYY